MVRQDTPSSPCRRHVIETQQEPPQQEDEEEEE